MRVIEEPATHGRDVLLLSQADREADMSDQQKTRIEAENDAILKFQTSVKAGEAVVSKPKIHLLYGVMVPMNPSVRALYSIQP